MAYPTKLNNLYKSEKKSGLTMANSFPEWYKTYSLNQQIVAPIQTSEELEAEISSKVLTKEEVTSIVTTLNPTTNPTKEPSKAEKARLIYDQMENAATSAKLSLVRKDIINRFMIELPISKVGANTYLQNIKIKKGLVKHN